MIVSESDAGGSEKKLSILNRRITLDCLVTSPDALPRSYRRLVGAEANKLGSCDKHPAYCEDWNADYTGVITKKSHGKLCVNNGFSH